MKMNYIKPVCEIEEFLTVQTSILSASGFSGEGDGLGDDTIGSGGEDDGTHNPSAKGEVGAWDIWN